MHAQKVGVVLSGGGANGLAHIGVLEALEEAQIPIDFITGTSAGAFIGALYACGYSPAEIKALIISDAYKAMTKGELAENDKFLLRKEYQSASMFEFKFAKDSLLKKVLPLNLRNSDYLDYEMFRLMAPHSASKHSNFDSLFIPFRCVASDIENKEVVLFKDGQLNQAVRASMTYPFYLNPITVNGKLLFDGGLYNNFPADIMCKEFDVDYIIGSNVSYNAAPPDEDDLLSQVTNMLVLPTAFSLPCEKGILIEPQTGITTFDFDDVNRAIDSGYVATKQKLDSIRLDVKRRINFSEIKNNRKNYKKTIIPLEVSEVVATDKKEDTVNYVITSIMGNNSKQNLSQTQFRKYYFRTLASPQIKQTFPTLNLKKDSTYMANLYVKKEKEFEVEVGGHFSSRPVNTGYLGLSYSNISKAGLTLKASSYFGKFYGSTKVKAIFDIPGKSPILFTPYFTLNRWDYFRSFATFFEEVRPSFLVQNEMYYGANFALPLGNNSKTELDFRIFNLEDDYYQTENFTQADTADITRFRGQTLSWSLERNVLNKKQWATAGHQFKIRARYVTGRERSISGSTSLQDYDFRKNHQWINIDASGTYFPLSTKRFKIGFTGKGVFNSQSLFANYTASILSTTAFTPLPDSKTFFLAEYRAPQYIGAGTNLILSFINGLDLRLDPFIFQPFKQIINNEDGTFGYSDLFGGTTFMGAASLIYHTPIGPLRLTTNYFPNQDKAFSLQLSFGYVIFNERAIR